MNIIKKIWAPWRISYIKKVEQPKGCVFCLKGQSPESQDCENLILERGKHNYILMNAFPYTPGHLLITPYQHVATPEQLSEEAYHELFALLLKWRKIMNSTMGAHGMNIGMNIGVDGGAGIAEHLHLHIVPRWKGDNNFMTTCSDTRVISQSMSEVYELYKKASTSEK